MQTRNLITTNIAELKRLASNHSPKPLARLKASLAASALQAVARRAEQAERERNQWRNLPVLTFQSRSSTPAVEGRPA